MASTACTASTCSDPVRPRRPGRRRRAPHRPAGRSPWSSGRAASSPGQPGRRRPAGPAGRPGRRTATAGRPGPPTPRSARPRPPAPGGARRRRPGRPTTRRPGARCRPRRRPPASARRPSPGRRSSCGRVAGPSSVHQHVAGRVGAHPVPPHPAVELLLAGGHQLRGEPADVVQLLAAGQPRHGGVPAAVDGPSSSSPVATSSTNSRDSSSPPVESLVGQPVALPGGRPGVQRRGAGRVERHRVDQHPRSPPSGSRTRSTACSWPGSRRVEKARPARHDRQRRRRRTGTRSASRAAKASRCGQRAQHARSDQASCAAVQAAVRGVGGVLQPAVGVGDRLAVQVLDEVEPGGEPGVAHRAEVAAARGRARHGTDGSHRGPARGDPTCL